jgi:hypothetical protein
MRRIDIADAILNLVPNAIFNVKNDTVEWLDERAMPPQKAIEKELARLQKESDANFYKHLRAAEYPTIGEQLDALFKAGVFPKEMAAKIQAVKDKYPKGE